MSLLEVNSIPQKLKCRDVSEEKLKEHIALFQKENVTVEELERLMDAK